MDKERLMHYRGILQKEKARLTEEMKRLTDEEHLSIKEATGELSSYGFYRQKTRWACPLDEC